jgi:hypothetical protein
MMKWDLYHFEEVSPSVRKHSKRLILICWSTSGFHDCEMILKQSSISSHFCWSNLVYTAPLPLHSSKGRCHMGIKLCIVISFVAHLSPYLLKEKQEMVNQKQYLFIFYCDWLFSLSLSLYIYIYIYISFWTLATFSVS